MMAVDEKSGDQWFGGHSEEDMNVCTNFYGKPSSSCRKLLLRTTDVNLMMVLKEKLVDH